MSKPTLDEILAKDYTTDVYGNLKSIIMIDGDISSQVPFKQVIAQLIADKLREQHDQITTEAYGHYERQRQEDIKYILDAPAPNASEVDNSDDDFEELLRAAQRQRAKDLGVDL